MEEILNETLEQLSPIRLCAPVRPLSILETYYFYFFYNCHLPLQTFDLHSLAVLMENSIFHCSFQICFTKALYASSVQLNKDLISKTVKNFPQNRELIYLHYNLLYHPGLMNSNILQNGKEKSTKMIDPCLLSIISNPSDATYKFTFYLSALTT